MQSVIGQWTLDVEHMESKQLARATAEAPNHESSDVKQLQ